MFTADSRYANQPLLEQSRPDGLTVRYAAPRILPSPDDVQARLRHRVTDSDRIELIAWKTLGAPQMWWRIAEANRASHPASLPGAAGETLLIPTATAAPVTG